MTVPSTGSALSALARLALVRVRRGKVLWVALAIGALPLLIGSLLRERGGMAVHAFGVVRDLLAIVPPLLVGAAIGEEIEDRTATYLWSRPLARWTVVVGKLLALAPIAIAIMCASWAAAALTAAGHLPDARSVGALAAGTLAITIISAGIATLVPKHAMALTIVYVLFDLMIGEIPVSLQQLSVTRHAEVLAGLGKTPVDATAIVAIVVIPALWLAVGLRRIRRLEV